MTNEEYKGIIRRLIQMIREDVPKEKLIEYLEELIEKKTK